MDNLHPKRKDSENTGDYFEIFEDKSLIKERDRDIQELIDGKQLSNTTFVIGKFLNVLPFLFNYRN